MVSIVIMAGGLGKRMNSDLPKVLHKVGNYPMLVHVIKTSLDMNVNKIIIIVGKFKNLIKEEVSKYFTYEELNKIIYIIQSEANGTGHAIQCANEEIKNLNENIIILSGDTPLISKLSLLEMIEKSDNSKCVLMVRNTNNNKGLGRILLKNDTFNKIVEEKDASDDEKKITLVNCGIYMIHSSLINEYIFNLNNNNNQKEYYLTDLISIIKNNNFDVTLFELSNEKTFELIGVNNLDELRQLNEIYKKICI